MLLERLNQETGAIEPSPPVYVCGKLLKRLFRLFRFPERGLLWALRVIHSATAL